MKRKDDPKLVDAVIAAGRLCSNCCYNIGQNGRREVSAADCDSMVKAYKMFDAAVAALLQTRKNPL